MVETCHGSEVGGVDVGCVGGGDEAVRVSRVADDLVAGLVLESGSLWRGKVVIRRS